MVKVVALDASNQVVAGYTGAIHFTSSDNTAALPGDYGFVAADHGMHVFAVTFATLGKQTIKVSDTTNNTLTGLAEVQVAARLPDDDLEHGDGDRGDSGRHGRH